MKNVPRIAILLCLIVVFGFRSDNGCSSFELLSKGTSWVWTNYSAEGKITSYIDFVVVSSKVKPGKVEALVNVNSRDTSGAQGKPMQVVMMCEKGKFTTSALGHWLTQFATMLKADMRLSSGDMVYPANLKVGDTLRDSYCRLSSNVAPGLSMSLDYEYSEKICDTVAEKTTPAGKWMCTRTNYTTTVDGSLTGGKSTVSTFNTVEWFSIHTGTVRLENYQKGKLMTYTELTSISYPK